MSGTPVRWGVLLAGGRASRIGGGDKGLRMLAGRPLLDHVIDRIRPQLSGGLLLNANGDPARFSEVGLTVIPDSVPDAGPLAGVLAGLEWLAVHRPKESWLLSVPVDCPFLPRDLVARLVAARDEVGAELACAASNGRLHPVVAVWPVTLRGALRTTLEEEGMRQVGRWGERFSRAQADYAEPVDPFFNVNSPTDLAEAERLATLI